MIDNKLLRFVKLLLSITLVGWLVLPAVAQRKKADKLYAARGYRAYLEMHDQKDLTKLDRQTLIRMGESSRKIGDQRRAERIYRTLIGLNNPDPFWHLYYAQALQTNGQYLKASEQFKICDQLLKVKARGKTYDQRARLGYETCDRMTALHAIGPVTIHSVPTLNSSSLDFSPIYFGDGLVWVSTRNPSERRDRWLGDNYMDWYYAKQEADTVYAKPTLFAEKLLTELHEGSCTFSKDQQTIYFTRNDLYQGKRGKSNDGTTKLNLYTAKLVDGVWTDEQELPFNNPEVDQAHPALDKSERILVFASNAKGGYGGMDLWASRLEDGEWSKPVNLGGRINTPGDEVFPFIHEDGTLYFASNGWSSLGGLDIFMATQVYNQPDSLWEFPFNVGAPINSSSDDFGLIINKEKTQGYYSSSRANNADNIYHFKVTSGLDGVAPLPSLKIDVCVYDDDTRLRLDQAQLTIVRDSELPVDTNTYTTNKYGYTACQFRAGDPYFIEVDCEGYQGVSDYFIMPKNVDGIQEYCIGLTRDGIPLEDTAKGPYYATSAIPSVNYVYNPKEILPPLHVKGRVLNTAYNLPLANSSVILLNRCTGEQLVMQVNDDGLFGFPLECGCEYVVKSQKNNFLEDNQVIQVPEDACDQGIVLDLELTPDEGNADQPILAMQTIQEGDVIELKNIFYDYDKWNIRADAVGDLNALVQLMERYPDLEIELSAHTDRRGSANYNQILSEKRARSARGYLLDQGIEAARVTAIGYGEERLVNTCQVCSESDHQENRRTEVLITKFLKKNE